MSHNNEPSPQPSQHQATVGGGGEEEELVAPTDGSSRCRRRIPRQLPPVAAVHPPPVAVATTHSCGDCRHREPRSAERRCGSGGEEERRVQGFGGEEVDLDLEREKWRYFYSVVVGG